MHIHVFNTCECCGPSSLENFWHLVTAADSMTHSRLGITQTSFAWPRRSNPHSYCEWNGVSGFDCLRMGWAAVTDVMCGRVRLQWTR